MVRVMLEENTEQTLQPREQAMPKDKIKTRADPLTSTTDKKIKAISAAKPSNAVSEPRIFANHKNMVVFHALYRVPTTESLPGELPWRDFLRALTNIGFSAEKLPGSQWMFCRQDGDSRQKISFHEPHPESKIPSQWCRHFARRLKIAFGWTMDTFVPKKEA